MSVFIVTTYKDDPVPTVHTHGSNELNAIALKRYQKHPAHGCTYELRKVTQEEINASNKKTDARPKIKVNMTINNKDGTTDKFSYEV